MSDRYRVLNSGFDDVRVTSFEQTPLVFPEPIQHEIDRRWAENVAKARAENRVLYDGQLAKLTSAVQTNGTLEIGLQRTSFSRFWATKDMPQTGFNPNDNPINIANVAYPLGVGVITITTDDTIVVGEKSAQTVDGKGRLSIAPAGYVNPDTDFGTLSDEREDAFGHEGYAAGRSPINTCHKEMQEELGLGTHRPVALVMDRIWVKHPLLITTARIPFKSSQVLERYQTTKKEYKSLEFVPNAPSFIEEFVEKNCERLYPHSEGALEVFAEEHDRFN